MARAGTTATPGNWWVAPDDGASTVTINATFPAVGADGENGWEIDPNVYQEGQGLWSGGHTYDSSLVPADGATISPGSAAIKSTFADDMQPTDTPTGQNGFVQRYLKLFCVSEPPTAPSDQIFLPSVATYNGQAARSLHIIDMDAFTAAFPTFDTTGVTWPGVLDHAALVEKINRSLAYYPVKPHTSSYIGYEGIGLPRGYSYNSSTTGANYGANVEPAVGVWVMHAMDPRRTIAERKAVLSALVQEGLFILDCLQNNMQTAPDGGHRKFQILPAIIAARALGWSASDVADNVVSPLMAQTYRITSAMMDPGGMYDWPHSSGPYRPGQGRLRSMISVTGAQSVGATVDVRYECSYDDGDHTRLHLGTPLTLIQPSNGARGTLTGYARQSGGSSDPDPTNPQLDEGGYYVYLDNQLQITDMGTDGMGFSSTGSVYMDHARRAVGEVVFFTSGLDKGDTKADITGHANYEQLYRPPWYVVALMMLDMWDETRWGHVREYAENQIAGELGPDGLTAETAFWSAPDDRFSLLWYNHYESEKARLGLS